MNQNLNQIILVTNALDNARTATETAFNLAKGHGAKILIVDTLREPSSISRWFSTNAKEVFEMVLADKQKRLASVANRFRDAGIDAASEILVGRTSEAVTRAAVDCQADLVVRYMKGANSRYPGLFGKTSRNLMRVCPCPVLFVNDRQIDGARVLACINPEHEVPENEAILRAAETLAADSNCLHGIYCWELHGKAIMRSHVTKEAIEQLQDEAKELHHRFFDNSQKEMKLGQFAGKIRIENGEPTDLIPRYCREHSIDVAVMCSASLNNPIHRYLGGTIESVLDELPCSLLVVKPDGFRSPVQSLQPMAEVKQ